MYIGHDENRTASQNYLLDSNGNIRKRKVQKVELSILVSCLLESASLLRNAVATAGCLSGKRT